MRDRRKHHGVRHAPECRRRLAQRAREDDDPRIVRAEIRRQVYEEELARHVEGQHTGGGVPPLTENYDDFTAQQPSASSGQQPPASSAVEVPTDDNHPPEVQADGMEVESLEVKVEESAQEDRQSLIQTLQPFPHMDAEKWEEGEIRSATQI